MRSIDVDKIHWKDNAAGKQVHYDGAKQGAALLLIHGIGPAASIPAEEK